MMDIHDQTTVIQHLREKLNEATVLVEKYKAAVDHLSETIQINSSKNLKDLVQELVQDSKREGKDI